MKSVDLWDNLSLLKLVLCQPKISFSNPFVLVQLFVELPDPNVLGDPTVVNGLYSLIYNSRLSSVMGDCQDMTHVKHSNLKKLLWQITKDGAVLVLGNGHLTGMFLFTMLFMYFKI